MLDNDLRRSRKHAVTIGFYVGMVMFASSLIGSLSRRQFDEYSFWLAVAQCVMWFFTAAVIVYLWLSVWPEIKRLGKPCQKETAKPPDVPKHAPQREKSEEFEHTEVTAPMRIERWEKYFDDRFPGEGLYYPDHSDSLDFLPDTVDADHLRKIAEARAAGKLQTVSQNTLHNEAGVSRFARTPPHAASTLEFLIDSEWVKESNEGNWYEWTGGGLAVFPVFRSPTPA